MKTRIRKITIVNQVFVWNYANKYNHIEDIFVSRLFFSLQNRKNTSVECFFKTQPHFFMGCHLNVGFFASKNGKEFKISFNQPKFISEFIQFIITSKVDFSKQERYIFYNANDFLKEMGYELFRSPYVFHPNEYYEQDR